MTKIVKASDTILDRLAVELTTTGEIDREPEVPALTSPGNSSDQIIREMKKVKQVIDLREGKSGSVLDKSLTLRDLFSIGGLQVDLGGRTYGDITRTPVRFPSDPGNGPSYVDPRPKLGTPPTLTGLTVNGALNNIIVSWTMTPYYNHSFVEVHRATTNNLGTAVLVGVSTGNQYVDSTGALGVTYFYWVRAVGFDVNTNAPITGAFNAVGGTPGGRAQVGGVDLGPLIVEAGNIANGAVIAAKIADATLTVAKFASGIEPVTVVATTPASYVTRAVFSIADQRLYYWNGTQYTGRIPTSDLIGTLSDAQIAAIAASKITGTLSDAQIAAIAASKITGALTNEQIADLDAAKLTNQITTTQITDNAISAPKIAAGAVVAGKLAADAVTAGTIAADAITARELAAGSVSAAELTADAVVAGKIAADAITARELAAGAVTAAKIVAGAVTTEKMTANSILGDRIQANSLDASKIVADSITAGQIAAGAINADEIAAGAVRVSKLLVIPESLCPDPLFRDTAFWSNPLDANGWYFADANPNFGGPGVPNYPSQMGVARCATLWEGSGGMGGSTARRAVWSPFLPFSGVGQRFRLRARFGNNANQTIYVSVAFHDALGAGIGGITVSSSAGSGFTSQTNQGDVPTGTTAMRFVVYNEGDTAWSGIAGVSEVKLDVAASGELIVDGVITADKLAANAVVAGKIGANAIAANNIIAGQITADKLDTAAVTTDKLNASAVTADKIGANAVTSDKIAANAITAGKIAASQIDASKLNVTTLSAITANMGDMTAGTMTLNTSTSSGWAYLRSATKWWADTTNGFIFAGYSVDGSSFMDLRAGSNYIRMSSGASVGNSAEINFSNNFTVNASGIMTAVHATMTNLTATGNITANALSGQIVNASVMQGGGTSNYHSGSGSSLTFTTGTSNAGQYLLIMVSMGSVSLTGGTSGTTTVFGGEHVVTLELRINGTLIRTYRLETIVVPTEFSASIAVVRNYEGQSLLLPYGTGVASNSSYTITLAPKFNGATAFFHTPTPTIAVYEFRHGIVPSLPPINIPPLPPPL